MFLNAEQGTLLLDSVFCMKKIGKFLGVKNGKIFCCKKILKIWVTKHWVFGGGKNPGKMYSSKKIVF